MSDNKPLLDGIRVLEVGTFVFGPAAATVMSDFGAEVTKIEAPGIGDPYRYLHTIYPMPVSEQEYCWILDGRNKKSVVVNLKEEAGREIVLKLAMLTVRFLGEPLQFVQFGAIVFNAFAGNRDIKMLSHRKILQPIETS